MLVTLVNPSLLNGLVSDEVLTEYKELYSETHVVYLSAYEDYAVIADEGCVPDYCDCISVTEDNGIYRLEYNAKHSGKYVRVDLSTELAIEFIYRCLLNKIDIVDFHGRTYSLYMDIDDRTEI
jgi:hypothetical protein